MLRIFKAGFSGNNKNTEPWPKFPFTLLKQKRVAPQGDMTKVGVSIENFELWDLIAVNYT